MDSGYVYTPDPKWQRIIERIKKEIRTDPLARALVTSNVFSASESDSSGEESPRSDKSNFSDTVQEPTSLPQIQSSGEHSSMGNNPKLDPDHRKTDLEP